MKLVLVSLLTLLVASFAQAETRVYRDGDFVKAAINDSADAAALYDALSLEEFKGRSGTSKMFKTADGKAEVYCSKSSIPNGMPYVCTVALNVKKNKKVKTTTMVYLDEGTWRASINAPSESKALYDALNIKEFEGRSGYARVYQTADLFAEIYCTESKLPVGLKNGCTVSIVLPKEQ